MKVDQTGSLISPQLPYNGETPSFSAQAIALFNYQHTHNPVYQAYCNALGVDAGKVTELSRIPFLPISFFRTQTVLDGSFMPAEAELVFESSGTTGEQTSRHFVARRAIYEDMLLAGFREFYGDPSRYAILGLLPSYLERPNASLVYMARTLMGHSGHADNGFYVDEWDALAAKMRALEAAGQPAILLGVTFALLDFAAAHPMPLRHTIVMETGGMKGRKKEMTREEVHAELMRHWQLPAIHAEYGMTELLSQAYAMGGGLFAPSATMRVFVRDINDPLDVAATGTGALNIIDLANVHSCSFIATDDVGRIYEDGTFEVLGRLDHSILRGCSQMVV